MGHAASDSLLVDVHAADAPLIPEAFEHRQDAGDTGGSGAGDDGVNTAMALASAGSAIDVTGSAGTSSGTDYGIDTRLGRGGRRVITLSSTSVDDEPLR